MTSTHRLGTVVIGTMLAGAGTLWAASTDWPQFRGPGSDAKVTGFIPPSNWPLDLKQVWKQPVGAGDSTPALVGDKLYVTGKQEGEEVTLCLEAATGKELWRDHYPVVAVTGGPARHPGPRSSPAFADGKLVTLGVGGILSCYDTTSNGKLLWRKDEFPKSYPQFYVASSPIITDGMAIAHLGGKDAGALMAFDLTTGDLKWKWTGDAPGYNSPVATTIGGVKQIINISPKFIVGLAAGTGEPLWQIAFPAAGGGGMGGGMGRGPGGGAPGAGGMANPPATQPGRGGMGGGGRPGGGGGGMAHNDASPIIDGDILYYTGASRGTHAVKIAKSGDAFTTTELWHSDVATAFNTPVLKDGMLYGIGSKGNLFCLDAKTGATVWTDTASRSQQGFGSIVDAGPVLLALTEASDLLVIKPGEKQYTELAKYKVSDQNSYSYPVVSGNKIYIRDGSQNGGNVILWSIE